MLQPNYTYKALVKRVVDGDTVNCSVDVGFKMNSEQRLRLSGIDTQELTSPVLASREGAKKARDFLVSILQGKEVLIVTTKTEKYGRYLAEIYYTDETGQQVNVSSMMLARGLAVPYSGGVRVTSVG